MLDKKVMEIVNGYIAKEFDCEGFKVVAADLRLDVLNSVDDKEDFDSLVTMYESIISDMLSKGYVMVDFEDGENFEDTVIEGNSLDVDSNLFDILVANTKLEKVFVRK